MKKSKALQTEKQIIEELVRHPGWLLMEKKAKIMLSNAENRLATGTKEQFEQSQGILKGLKLWHDLIVTNPLDIINIQGVWKITDRR